MSRHHLRFAQLDVFTSTPFLGNPLAIVHLPNGTLLSQDDKQLVAREFNLSETVFLHQHNSASDAPVVIEIFTPNEELPFAGHPTVGTSFYLLSLAPERDTITLQTRAGLIPVVRAAGGTKVRLQAPIDFMVHQRLTIPSIKTLQPHLTDADFVNGATGGEACASVVKGMTFLLLEISSEDALRRMQPYPTRLSIPDAAKAALGEWAQGFTGMYAFYRETRASTDSKTTLRTRAFDGPVEDPATGSAACTLCGWLALQNGSAGLHEFNILQGVEMGRRSEITVVVDVGTDQKIKSIALEGAAVEVMEGTVTI
ncbi:Phenazine biosynthesis PhzC/PhzF protein [Mycena kentingensis (nom. inval.)]|nr:Phenazine biosynthesis PhzC/PhzF protein [Mycena kentingensis (nom. inval.)]